MSYTGHKFAPVANDRFFQVLRQRVNQHFATNNLSKQGSAQMLRKTAFMFTLFLVPYLVMLLGEIENRVVFVLLWLAMGLGMAGIGLSVMHDANHGAYSKKKWLNKLMGYSMNLLGSNAEIWKIQHNRLHHTYTNIEGADEDLNGPPVLRLSPTAKRFAMHKYQYVYAWFLYGLATLARVTVREFVQLFSFRKQGLVRDQKTFQQLLVSMILWKALHFGFILVLPMIVTSQPAWLVVVAFLLMHYTVGFILSMIFQTAHIMPACSFPTADDDGAVGASWAAHQLQTTTNYAPNSRVFGWLIGGLNYQVEHHLFPRICHVHYPAIASIVAQTAKEFNIPYHSQSTFFNAIGEHAKMLKKLGTQ